MEGSEMPRFSRVAVLGDVHTEAETVRRTLDYIDAHASDLRVEACLCVGDIVDGEGDADATLNLLRERNVICVAGNHERWWLHGEMRHLAHATPSLTDENRAYIDAMPSTLRFDTPAGGALLCHGVGEDDEAFLRPDTRGYDLQIHALRELMLDTSVQYMVGGHTHERMVRRFQGLVVVNAGTLRRNDNAGFIVADFEQALVRCFDCPEFGTLISEVAPLTLPAPMPLPDMEDDDLY